MLTLRIIGSLYVLLGLWCTLLPAKTAKAVGFQLVPGHGQSEYVTVYGGLEVGFGLAMILTSLRADLLPGGLAFAAIVSAALPCFRIVTLMIYSVTTTTWILAAAEIVFALALILAWFRL